MDSRQNRSLLVALEEANRYYTTRYNLTKQQRYDGVISLSEWDLFTVGQLAQLSGYSTATLYGWGVKRGWGSGNFNPQSLDTMRLVLLNRIGGKRPNPVLIESLVKDGNSHRTIYKFTGVQPSTVSRMMKRINDNQSTDL